MYQQPEIESSPSLIVIDKFFSLPPIYYFSATDELGVLGSTSGVAISAYGTGQLTGVVYTVPAHAQIDVDFKLQLQCVTPDNIKNMDALIKSLLDASRQSKYEEMSRTSVSGGVGFFGFWSGGVRASYEKTKQRMDQWGLSEENQQKIVTEMLKIANTFNEFNYKGTIYNRDYDYSVTGSLFGIVMDCEIKQDDATQQVRALAPNVHVQGDDGTTLPSIGKLY